MTLYRNYLDIVATHQEEANTNMEIGGNKVHCEADEVGFRCRPIWIGDEGFVEWFRYIAVVRRGSSRIFLEKLPSRHTRGAGQGIGGALAIEEFMEIFRVYSDTPLLARGSILHTDGAKADRRAEPMYWPPPGGLNDADLVHDGDFTVLQLQHKWTHTSVCHKRKPGQPAQYAVTRTIRVHDGTMVTCKCGSQCVDGFWSSLRRAVWAAWGSDRGRWIRDA